MKTRTLILAILMLASQGRAVDLDGEELFNLKDETPRQAQFEPQSTPSPMATPIEKAPEPTSNAPQAVAPQAPQKKAHHKPKTKTEAPAPIVTGNLPVEFVQRPTALLSKTVSVTVTQSGNIKSKLKGLRPGDIVFGRILHSIIAFPDETAPVVAELTDGPFKGARLLGTSRLEPQSQRVFIDFTMITSNGQTYAFKSSAVTSEGQTGFLGEFHSQEAKYFTGDFISSFVSAYFNGLVPRTTNPFGYVIEDTSPTSAVNKGLAAGAMSSADRFRDKLKNAKAFSEMKGPIEIGVLITQAGVQQ